MKWWRLHDGSWSYFSIEPGTPVYRLVLEETDEWAGRTGWWTGFRLSDDVRTNIGKWPDLDKARAAIERRFSEPVEDRRRRAIRQMANFLGRAQKTGEIPKRTPLYALANICRALADEVLSKP